MYSRAGRLEGLGAVEEMALARAGAWVALLTMFCTNIALQIKKTWFLSGAIVSNHIPQISIVLT